MLQWIRNRWAGLASTTQNPSNARHAEPVQLHPSAQALVSDGNAWLDKGNLLRAEECFAKACELCPQDERARVNLAYVLIEQQRPQNARSELERVVQANPEHADAQYLLAGVHTSLGDVERAVQCLQHALVANSGHTFALRDLCMLLSRHGRAREALDILAASDLNLRQEALAFFIKGNLLFASRDMAASESCFNQCAKLTPDDPAVHLNLANVRLRRKNFTGAADSAERTLAIDPGNVSAMVTLGIACLEQGQLADAARHGHRAIQANPGFVRAHVFMGRLQAALGNLQAAIDALQRAHVLDPLDPEAMQRLAGCHQDSGDLTLALQFRSRALKVDPHDPMGHVQHGMTLQLSGKLGAAMASFHRALELDPGCAEALSNLGGACIEFGDLMQARSHLEAAVALDPTSLAARSNLLFMLSASQDTNGTDYLHHAAQYGALVSSELPPAACAVRSGQPGVDRHLRVGLVSGDFRTHPVGRFLASTLAGLDRQRVWPIAYASAALEDGLTHRLRQSVREWHPVAALGDEALATLIRSHQLDVLVDLSGHTGHSRLPIFARRLAPVQISWLGYWASTGVPAMDFMLADSISAPLGSEHEFSERIWRLPQGRMCYTTPENLLAVRASPAPRERNGYVTFGSYQTLAKINDCVLEVWRQILHGLPGARLRLQSRFLGDLPVYDALETRIKAAGIDPERVTMLGASAYEDYMRSYDEVDLVLDTFPFTGGTTTCEALWMGVPTLTLSGASMIGRQGASLMTHAGVPEFVVHTRDQYVQWACAFGNSASSRWKRGHDLRATVQQSSVFDGSKFARQLETAWLEMCKSIRAQP